jgi:hypothetical protein
VFAEGTIGLELDGAAGDVGDDRGDTMCMLSDDVLGQGWERVACMLSRDGGFGGGEGRVEEAGEDGLGVDRREPSLAQDVTGQVFVRGGVGFGEIDYGRLEQELEGAGRWVRWVEGRCLEIELEFALEGRDGILPGGVGPLGAVGVVEHCVCFCEDAGLHGEGEDCLEGVEGGVVRVGGVVLEVVLGGLKLVGSELGKAKVGGSGCPCSDRQVDEAERVGWV